MKVKKDILIRKLYSRNELFFFFTKKLEKSSKISNKNKIFAKIVQRQISKCFNITRHRNMCNFSRKPRAIVRDFRASGYSIKERSRSLNLTGLKKSS